METGIYLPMAYLILSRAGVEEICDALRPLLADVFALYVKTKNFHWHMRGRHFRDYHLLLDEHAEQIFAMTDDIAERARKLGGRTLHSISDIAKYQRIKDNNREVVGPDEMLSELCSDNQQLVRSFRAVHEVSRPAQRRGHHQPDRKLDRRNRTARVVSLRDCSRMNSAVS